MSSRGFQWTEYNHLVTDLIDAVLKREGGDADRASDRGEATHRGITFRTLQEWHARQGKPPATIVDLWNLTEAETREIYRVFFIKDPGIGCIRDYHLLELMFDCLVQHPPKEPIKWLQAACGVTQDGIMGNITCNEVEAHGAGFLYGKVLASRLVYYAQIVANDRTQAASLVGWMNRMRPFVERAV